MYIHVHAPLFALYSLGSSIFVLLQVDDTLQQLARAQEMQSVQDLYYAHAQDIAHEIKVIHVHENNNSLGYNWPSGLDIKQSTKLNQCTCTSGKWEYRMGELKCVGGFFMSNSIRLDS